MDVYRIGASTGPQRVGYARNAADIYQSVRDSIPDLYNLQLQVLSMDTGRAMLVDAVFRHHNHASLSVEFITKHNIRDALWYDLTPAQVMTSLSDIEEHANPMCLATTAKHIPDAAEVGAAIYGIRTKLFGTTQELFGEIAGKSVAVVSRWEAGESKPGLDELLRIRAAAKAFGLPWEDRLILEPQLSEF